MILCEIFYSSRLIQATTVDTIIVRVLPAPSVRITKYDLVVYQLSEHLSILLLVSRAWTCYSNSSMTPGRGGTNCVRAWTELGRSQDWSLCKLLGVPWIKFVAAESRKKKTNIHFVMASPPPGFVSRGWKVQRKMHVNNFWPWSYGKKNNCRFESLFKVMKRIYKRSMLNFILASFMLKNDLAYCFAMRNFMLAFQRINQKLENLW